MIGILAYGSLVTDPGDEIRDALDYRVEGVNTPFPIEYARKSSTRHDAPTLVPVPTGIGSQVNGVILVLKTTITEEEAKNMLYRREIHDVGSGKTYTHVRKSKNRLLIKTLENFHEIPIVIYTCLEPNFGEILAPCLPDEEKAKYLAKAAINSITPDTFREKKDGIWYLHQNIQSNILTPLTEPYKNEILRQANVAADLPAAREYFAQVRRLK